MAPTELPGNSSGCSLGYPTPYSVPPDPTLQEPSAAPAQPTTTGTPHRERAHTAPQISTNMATMPNLLLNPQAVPLPSTHTPTSLRPQYEYKDRSDDYQAYKIRRGIQGGILILISQIQRHSPQEEIYPANAPPITDDTFIHNIFSAYTTLPFETPDISLFAFPIMDNKADTLTQSQMLKASDASAFTATQPKEIKGLMDMAVFEFPPCLPNLRMHGFSVPFGATAGHIVQQERF
jgi:hypothetical protein